MTSPRFGQVPRWAIPVARRAAGFSGVSVYTLMATYAHARTHEAYPSIGTVADILQTSRRTVHSALKRLEQAGLITRVGRKPGGVVVYRLAWDEPEDDEKAAGQKVRGQGSRSVSLSIQGGVSRGPQGVSLAIQGGTASRTGGVKLIAHNHTTNQNHQHTNHRPGSRGDGPLPLLRSDADVAQASSPRSDLSAVVLDAVLTLTADRPLPDRAQTDAARVIRRHSSTIEARGLEATIAVVREWARQWVNGNLRDAPGSLDWTLKKGFSPSARPSTSAARVTVQQDLDVPWCGHCESSTYRWVTDRETDSARPCPECSRQAVAKRFSTPDVV